MTWTVRDVALLRCPACGGGLRDAGDLHCTGCGEDWPVRGGLPILYREAWVQGNDRLLRVFYDHLPRLHDPAVRYLLPIWQLQGSERQIRNGCLDQLALDGLQPRPDRPLRILDVGIGTGGNVDLVRERLPRGVAVDYWGLDLSTGMLSVCRERLAHRPVQLVQGDAHALPFPDGSFDRVLHVGGIGAFRDPAKALAEMARVAVPGTPIVVCDEQLDPHRAHGAWPRLWFRALTFYDRTPHCPHEALPPGAQDVAETQVSRFYYSLRFRMPA